MGYFADEYMTGAVVPDDMPEELLDNPDVKRLLENVYAVLEDFEEWVDPRSEAYALDFADARQEGAWEVWEEVFDVLADAEYRQNVLAQSRTVADVRDQLEAARKEAEGA
jgi:hypothetical protein